MRNGLARTMAIGALATLLTLIGACVGSGADHDGGTGDGGEDAPDFEFPDAEGGTHSLYEFLDDCRFVVWMVTEFQ